MQINNITIPPERIANLFAMAIEGGSTYWLRSAKLLYRQNQPMPQATANRAPWYSDPTLYDGKFKIEISFDDRGAEGWGVIGEDNVAHAFALMMEKWRKAWDSFLDESDDASTADVFLQLVIFSEVRMS